MKGLKKWMLLLLAVALVGNVFVSCSDDDDDDDDTMTYYLLQQQQKQKQEAEKKAQEEANTAPEDKVGVEYKDEGGNTVVQDSQGNKTVTDKEGHETKVKVKRTLEGEKKVDGGEGSMLKETETGVMKEKYVFYDDGNYLHYQAMYILENGELEEGNSEEYNLANKGKYTGDVMQDGVISLSDIQNWTRNPTEEQQAKLTELQKVAGPAMNEYMSALNKALLASGKTFEEFIQMSEAEQDKIESTKEVQEAKKKADEAQKAYNDFYSSLKPEWVETTNTSTVEIENGKVKMN